MLIAVFCIASGNAGHGDATKPTVAIVSECYRHLLETDGIGAFAESSPDIQSVYSELCTYEQVALRGDYSLSVFSDLNEYSVIRPNTNGVRFVKSIDGCFWYPRKDSSFAKSEACAVTYLLSLVSLAHQNPNEFDATLWRVSLLKALLNQAYMIASSKKNKVIMMGDEIVYVILKGFLACYQSSCYGNGVFAIPVFVNNGLISSNTDYYEYAKDVSNEYINYYEKKIGLKTDKDDKVSVSSVLGFDNLYDVSRDEYYCTIIFSLLQGVVITLHVEDRYEECLSISGGRNGG